MIIKKQSLRYWYLKKRSERLLASTLVLPPAVAMCLWSGLSMNDNPKLLLLHCIGWTALIAFAKRFLIVEGVALVNDKIRVWQGPSIFGFFWYSTRLEFTPTNLKWQSIQKKDAHPQHKYRIQISGDAGNQRKSWVFMHPFPSRKESRTFISNLRDLTHPTQLPR